MDILKSLIEKSKNDLKQKIGNKRTFKSSDLIDYSELKSVTKKIHLNIDYSSNESIISSTVKENETILSRNEVIKILRKRNEPIKCFGETDSDSYQRMKLIQLVEPKHDGLGNDYKAAMEKVDEDEAVESYRQRDRGTMDYTHNNLEVTIISDELDDRLLRRMRRYLSSYCLSRESVTSANRQFYNVNTDDDSDGEKDIIEFNKDDKKDPLKVVNIVTDYVLQYMKFLLSVWGRHLNSRSKSEKATFIGKQDSATYNQTVEYIKPLFILFKNRTMSDDILDSMVKIVALLLDRHYMKATEAYMELAIGNAPWPLGVTNHGIHARTAQEKIYAKNVAHVLNDEVQRKYIQAVKRLITRNQIYFPTMATRCVNYLGR